MQEKRHDRAVEMRLCFFSRKAGDYKMLFVATRKCRSTCGFLFPAYSQGGALVNCIDIFQDNELYPHTEFAEMLLE